MKKLAWKVWLYGLGTALIGGGSGAVVAGFTNMVVDSDHFNMKHPTKLLESISTVFMISAILSMMNYLKQSPLPAVETVTTVQTVETHPTTMVVKTVQTTETNTAPPASPEAK